MFVSGEIDQVSYDMAMKRCSAVNTVLKCLMTSGELKLQ